jgi:hypothetical protein
MRFSWSTSQDGVLHMEGWVGPKISPVNGNIARCSGFQHTTLLGYDIILLFDDQIMNCAFIAIRQMLIRRNQKLDADEKAAMEGANRARVEEAARLEGITFEQAMERRKGYRYLYWLISWIYIRSFLHSPSQWFTDLLSIIIIMDRWNVADRSLVRDVPDFIKKVLRTIPLAQSAGR